MKRSIKIAVAAAIALSATSAFATNGDTMIGVGAKSIGMGGVGIGISHGAESALTNPAMISTVKGTEVSFGGTIFMPDVKSDPFGAGMAQSEADLSVIPTVAIAQKGADFFTWGIGMYGVAGMGTDYSTNANNYEMKTNLQLMQFVLPLAFEVADGLTLGIAPILQYGSLDISYTGSTTKGVSQDFGAGYTAGLGYTVAGFTGGISYKSAIDMSYAGQISEAASGFGLTLSNHLEQPAEYGIGVSYKLGNNTLAFDYKKIKWSSAKGYRDFGWDDQNVYMLGYQYAQDGWAVRAGYNYAKSPIKDQGMAGTALNTLNLLGFPAIVEQHYTVGGSFSFSKMTSLDLAYVYSPEVSETFASGMSGTGTISTKHSQDAITAQLNLNF